MTAIAANTESNAMMSTFHHGIMMIICALPTFIAWLRDTVYATRFEASWHALTMAASSAYASMDIMPLSYPSHIS